MISSHLFYHLCFYVKIFEHKSVYFKKEWKNTAFFHYFVPWVKSLDPLKQVLGRMQYNISWFQNAAINHRKHFPYSRFVDNVVMRDE